MHMIDVNLRAIDLAKRNAEHNQLKNVTVWESDLYEKVEGKYDLIISNPPIRAGKKIVHGIFEGATEHLKPHGELWIVVQKKQGAPSAYEKLATRFEMEIIAKEKAIDYQGRFSKPKIKKVGFNRLTFAHSYGTINRYGKMRYFAHFSCFLRKNIDRGGLF